MSCFSEKQVEYQRMDCFEEETEADIEETETTELAISKASADKNYYEAGQLVDEDTDQINLKLYRHLLSDSVHIKLMEVLEETKLPFQLADFQKLSLHVIGSKRNLILISPTGCGKMLVVLLGTLLLRKVNQDDQVVSIGTQPLSLLMDEKMTNKVNFIIFENTMIQFFFSWCL